jgi:predicted dehydrogenase
MKFENDVIGKVFVSGGCTRGYTMRTCIYGTEGTIIVDNTSPTLSLFKKKYEGQEKFCGIRAHEIEIKLPVQINNHNLGGEIEDFCKCIAEGKPVVTSGVEGASTVSVCLSIVESFKTGKNIKVDYNF